MKKKNKQRQKGFSLVETLVTMSLFFIIMFGVYAMIEHYGAVTKTEHSRMKLQQESRYMVSVFADELKEAGSVLTLAGTGAFLAAPPFFNGIYPLNSTYFPDGVIIATGDPTAVTVLTQNFTPSDKTFTVESASVADYDASSPYENFQWRAGDRGIIIGTTGYYVFTVISVDLTSEPNTITIGDTPVYYSGLLVTGGYLDDAQGNMPGDKITYSPNSPVIRVTNFSIYVFREIDHPSAVDKYGYSEKIRQLIRITDTKGLADPLIFGSNAEYSIISENIWELQISYRAYENFAIADRHTTDPTHHYFAGGITSPDFNALMIDIRDKKLKQIDISLIALGDDLGGSGESSASADISPIGDLYSITLPTRKLSFRLFSFSVEPRNYNIIL